MDVTCQFEDELAGSGGCLFTVDVDGGGTYTDTSFDYTYDNIYTCNGATCDFIQCATILGMATTVNIVGEYVGD